MTSVAAFAALMVASTIGVALLGWWIAKQVTK